MINVVELLCSQCSQPFSVEKKINGRRQCPSCRNKYLRDRRTALRADSSARERLKAANRKSNSAIGARYAALAQGARRRGLDMAITRDQYAPLLRKPCHYCGFPINATGAGLDRKDSSVGYTMENVVPCCYECNVAKSDKFTYDEMVEIGAAIRSVKIKRQNAMVDIKSIISTNPNLLTVSPSTTFSVNRARACQLCQSSWSTGAV